MSTTAHSVFLLPRSNFRVICINGLSSIEAMQIEKFYNFGGNIHFENCGAVEQFATLAFAEKTMENGWLNVATKGTVQYDDYY